MVTAHGGLERHSHEARIHQRTFTASNCKAALLLQSKQCRNCHAIGDEGGHRGPDLSDVGTRMNEPELVRQVIQGGGNMPAYGNTLTPQEVKALVAYLVSLRPPNTIPAQNPAIPLRDRPRLIGRTQNREQMGARPMRDG